jgi:phosphoglycolate phosphatase
MRIAVRALVFDLDGTLVDSKVDLANSVNHALAEFGLPVHPLPVIYSYIGDGASILIRRAVGKDGDDVLPHVLSCFLDHYRSHLLDTTVPYPGVEKALRDRAGDYSMAVLTNKPLDMTRSILSALSLDRYFRDVRGGDSFENKKPHPEGLLRVIEGLGASPAETLMVGDSRNDVLAGKGAGAFTCGVTYGLGAEGFAAHSPDFTVDRFPDLFRRIRPAPKGNGAS